MFNPTSQDCDWPLNVAKIRSICQELIQPVTPNPTTLPPVVSQCDPSVPHVEHPTDCQLFYHCVPGSYGAPASKVLKKCGPGTLFHPVTMICDWPDSVALVKPECGMFFKDIKNKLL